MWHESENGSMDKPAAIDRGSSKVFIYVRKDFQLVEATETVPAHWKWLEAKIRKEDWDLFEGLMDHDTALDDVYAALTELAEMIVEGE